VAETPLKDRPTNEKGAEQIGATGEIPTREEGGDKSIRTTSARMLASSWLVFGGPWPCRAVPA
jgi:hypothetical protein